jgi:FtsH-binding integral membrane protein
MAEPTIRFGTQGAYARPDVDEGLRSYMLRVYNYMGAGLALSGIIAYIVGNSPETMSAIYGTPLQWVVLLSPLAFSLVLSFGINRISAGTAQALFWAFAATMGVSLASIFVVYTGASIARVFFISAATFGAMSLYGYTTKRNLAQFSSFLFMGLVGVVLASVVNLFLASSGLSFVISVVGVLVFVGLTAHDTQAIREWYAAGDDAGQMTKKAIYGALTLYLDFINLMLMLLRLFGERRQ